MEKLITYDEAKELLKQGLPVYCQISLRNTETIVSVEELDRHKKLKEEKVQDLFSLSSTEAEFISDIEDVEYLLNEGEEIYCIYKNAEKLVSQHIFSLYKQGIIQEKLVFYWYG